MKYVKYLIATVLFLSAMSVFAKVEKNLYSGAVPVQSQSANERNAALPQALGEVLVKVSGNSAVTTLPRVKDQLTEANQILRSYRYLANDDTKYPYLLMVSFDPNAVNQILTTNHQAIWGADRPSLLFWVVENTNAQVAFVSSDDAPDIYTSLSQAASGRGLPIVYPLLDLTDLNDLSVDDVINTHDSAIINASQRYPHTGIVTVVLTQTPDKQWQGQWMLELNGQRSEFDVEGADANQAIVNGVNQLADNIATSYSVLHLGGNHERGYQLEVYGINSVDEYAKVSQYLKHLSSVKQVTIVKVMPGKVTYDLQVSGDRQLLQQAISIDNLLEPYSDVTASLDDTSVLSYRVRS